MNNILIIGHTGFLGNKFLEYLNSKNEKIVIHGISRSILSATFLTNIDQKNIILTQSTSFDANLQNKPEWVFFLAHSQNSNQVLKEEENLADKVIHFIKKNNINCPIVLIKSAGKNSRHIASRTLFNDRIKNELKNTVYEIKSAIISEPGSVSYEIPCSIVKKVKIIPQFPWMNNTVSLTTSTEIFKKFEQITNGMGTERVLTPEHRNLTYKQYLEEIAHTLEKNITFVMFPFNDLLITPVFVHLLSRYPYHLVKNLMGTLRENALC